MIPREDDLSDVDVTLSRHIPNPDVPHPWFEAARRQLEDEGTPETPFALFARVQRMANDYEFGLQNLARSRAEEQARLSEVEHRRVTLERWMRWGAFGSGVVGIFGSEKKWLPPQPVLDRMAEDARKGAYELFSRGYSWNETAVSLGVGDWYLGRALWKSTYRKVVRGREDELLGLLRDRSTSQLRLCQVFGFHNNTARDVLDTYRRATRELVAA